MLVRIGSCSNYYLQKARSTTMKRNSFLYCLTTLWKRGLCCGQSSTLWKWIKYWMPSDWLSRTWCLSSIPLTYFHFSCQTIWSEFPKNIKNGCTYLSGSCCQECSLMIEGYAFYTSIVSFYYFRFWFDFLILRPDTTATLIRGALRGILSWEPSQNHLSNCYIGGSNAEFFSVWNRVYALWIVSSFYFLNFLVCNWDAGDEGRLCYYIVFLRKGNLLNGVVELYGSENLALFVVPQQDWVTCVLRVVACRNK
jgi:hypothetical protein